MNLLDRISPSPNPPDVTEQSAEYEDGALVCHRCSKLGWTLYTSMNGSRRMVCGNCGFSGSIDDGVELSNRVAEELEGRMQ